MFEIWKKKNHDINFTDTFLSTDGDIDDMGICDNGLQ